MAYYNDDAGLEFSEARRGFLDAINTKEAT